MTGRKPKAKQAVTVEALPGAQGAVVGYARTSTVEQEAGLEAQRRDLTAAGSAQGVRGTGVVHQQAGPTRGGARLPPGRRRAGSHETRQAGAVGR